MKQNNLLKTIVGAIGFIGLAIALQIAFLVIGTIMALCTGWSIIGAIVGAILLGGGLAGYIVGKITNGS